MDVSRLTIVGSTFDRDGSLTVRAAIPGDELAAMRAVFTALVPAIVSRRRAGNVLSEVTGAARTHGPLAAIARHPRFGALAAAALGAPRVQLLQESLLYKPPYCGGSVEWHQDHTYVGYLTPPRVVSLRIPLYPEDEGNGCMRVVDGSHAWGPVGEVRALREKRVTSLVRSLDAAQRNALAHARSLVLAPGDVSIHHCLTVHSSTHNRSSRARRTIILRIFDADCRLVSARLPQGAERYFPTDKHGRLSTDEFPLVHVGGAKRPCVQRRAASA